MGQRMWNGSEDVHFPRDMSRVTGCEPEGVEEKLPSMGREDDEQYLSDLISNGAGKQDVLGVVRFAFVNLEPEQYLSDLTSSICLI